MPDGAMAGRKIGADRSHTDVVTVPNVITFARLCAVPAAVWLVVRQDLGAAFALFVVAGLSDAVDGWLARRKGATRLGALLDPLADKALLVSMYVTLASTGVLPDAVAILVVFRDAVIVGGVVVLSMLGHSVTIRPLLISKLNTALQIILVAFALMAAAFALAIPGLLTALAWLVAISTLASGAAYVWDAAHRPGVGAP